MSKFRCQRLHNSIYAQQFSANRLFGHEVTTSPNGRYDGGVLTSRYEGFFRVYPEAAEFGFYLIYTDLSAIQDLINRGAYSGVFPIEDQAAFTQILLANSKPFGTKAVAMQLFAYENFYWPNLVKKLDQWLWK